MSSLRRRWTPSGPRGGACSVQNESVIPMPKRVAKPKMIDCEMKKLFKVEGVKSARWIVREVKGLEETPTGGTIRCRHCRGPVRFYKQKFRDGPVDHVDHVNRVDSEGCAAGAHFKGTHARSATPVL